MHYKYYSWHRRQSIVFSESQTDSRDYITRLFTNEAIHLSSSLVLFRRTGGRQHVRWGPYQWPTAWKSYDNRTIYFPAVSNHQSTSHPVVGEAGNSQGASDCPDRVLINPEFKREECPDSSDLLACSWWWGTFVQVEGLNKTLHAKKKLKIRSSV